MRLHHVQVACPPGGEDDARRFYADALGLTEVEKPADLAGRGGAWFRAHDAAGAVTAEIHVGVEDPFGPARKAHPALLLDPPDTAAARPTARSTPWPRAWRRSASRSTSASSTRSRASSASTRRTRTATGSRCCSFRWPAGLTFATASP